MKAPYNMFWRVNEGSADLDVSGIKIISHGSDKESFRKSFEDNCCKDSVEMYRKDNPKILCVGFVVDNDGIREWHTVRLGAWSYGEFQKEMLGDSI